MILAALTPVLQEVRGRLCTCLVRSISRVLFLQIPGVVKSVTLSEIEAKLNIVITLNKSPEAGQGFHSLCLHVRSALCEVLNTDSAPELLSVNSCDVHRHTPLESHHSFHLALCSLATSLHES
ncbi:hypothetical protein J6590_083246 [Homalodisca vitripennis]|nr:hypothetical protein J6590_083246 [Homalodisca vitripennis]